MTVTLVLLGIAGFVGYYEGVYQHLTRSLEADVGTLRRLRWERPVLRGTPGDANASLEEMNALAGWKALPDAVREGLATNLYYGKPLDAAQQAAVQEHAKELDALRAGTLHAFAHTDLATELGEQMRVPDYPRVVDAALLLLARASTAAPDECLRITNDVIRVGQDLVPGGPLEASSVATRINGLVVPVAARCAGKADPGTLRRAAHELHTLATHAPPTGAGIELQDLVTAMKLRQQATLSSKLGPAAVVHTLLERPNLLHAWSLYTDPTRFRQLVPAHYPDALDEWKTEQDMRTRSELPLVAADAAGVLDYLYDDMRGQALLRGLTLGMATLAERAYRGKTPNEPAGGKEPELCDPFRGQPFGYRIAADGSEIVLWSVGEDLHDDHGSDEWTDAAPIDVTLHFPLALIEEPKEQKTKRAL